jgi:hypothetical protein
MKQVKNWIAGLLLVMILLTPIILLGNKPGRDHGYGFEH